ncbi:MAG: FAD-dependent oxidoreductase [bacterium]|nr:FAD-dependent oxidoreductase [bacterium]
MKRQAFVLGGGVAGMTAAFGLADRGFAVTLLESRQWLGGRAFAFVDRQSGRRLDNGPHVMLGCYRATRTLVERLGTSELFQQDRRLTMMYRREGGDRTELRLPALPVPLAMPIGLFGLKLGFGARLRALFGMATALLGAPASWTVADWVQRRGQRGEPATVLFEPLCRAIMNVEMHEASARDFLATLKEAFTGRASRAAFWVPRATWSEIFAEPAPAALAAAGVELRTGARITGFGVDGEAGRIHELQLGNGEPIAVGADDLVISAMPWSRLAKLVPDLAARELRSSPIVTAHFSMRDPIVPDEGPVVALAGGEPFHFVLRTIGADLRHFGLLSGGDRSFDGQSVEAIAETARAQLRRFYPDLPADFAAEIRISRENAATFVAAPGSEALRPAPGPLSGGPRNLRICGDWTGVGLPATLEGAARSAERMLAVL